MNDRDLEARLRAWYRAEAGEAEAAPLHLRQDVVAIPRTSPHSTRRAGRGRGITLLAAAALLIVGGALAAGSGLLRLPTVVPPVPEPSVVAVTTASPDATSPSPSESAAPSASPIPVAGPGGVWIQTGSMVTPRSGHDAVRLLDGRVLVIGLGNDGESDTSAELYDPASGTWSATGSMLKPRAGFPPTLLLDGKVLVGDVDDPDPATDDDEINGAEVYDPATGTWSATAKMVSRGGSTATLLRDGKVLVIGYDDTGELFDPVRGTWSATGKMTTPRHSHTALLLPDGKVLVAGGHAPGDEPTDAAELYDPDTGSWTAIASMHAKRDAIEAFVLPSGKALVLGSSRGEPWSAELYDPVSESWTTANGETSGAGFQAATSMADGTVLTTGGGSGPEGVEEPFTLTQLYDPRLGIWTTMAPMLRSHGAPAILLLDGTVLVAGGSTCNSDGMCVSLGAAELYVPAGVSPPPLPAFPSPPPPVFPSPTPRPTPLPPADGPVPPNARTWKVTVDNKSSEPAVLFVAEEDASGVLRLVGSATPNVVPAGAAVQVTFRFPARGDPDDGWIFVNPRPGEGGSLVNADQIGIPGKIWITADGQVGWLSP